MLTERDRELTSWIVRVGATRPVDLMLRFSVGRTVAYRRVKELVDAGLVVRHRLMHGDDGVLTATKAGLRFTESDHLMLASVSLASITHTLACASITALIERDLVGGALYTDREHRASEANMTKPLGSAVVGHTNTGQRRLHRPDMIVIRDFPVGGIEAIEVELAVKKRERVEDILRGYRRNPAVTKVRYYAPDNVAAVVRRASEATNTLDIVDVLALPDCIGERRLA